MKKMPLLFLVPMGAIVVVVGIAIAIRLFSGNTTAPTNAEREYPSPLAGQSRKPSTFLGGLLGGNTPSPTPATAVDLTRELQATYDDGGASDFNSIDISGL